MAILQERFTFPAIEPGAIIEYQTDEFVDWFYPPTWYFDTYVLARVEEYIIFLEHQELVEEQNRYVPAACCS